MERITKTTKLRKNQLNHLKQLIYEDSEMLFVDYINLCDALYDGIEIDKNTIYLINSNFRKLIN